MQSDELIIVSKIQKAVKQKYHGIGEAMMAGTVDNMEKYKYMLGQAHAYINILQEISILLNPKEQKNDNKGPDNIIQFESKE